MILKKPKKKPWVHSSQDGFEIYSAGHWHTLQSILKQLKTNPSDFDALGHVLLENKLPFACIITHADFTFAVVDRIRSFPIFYHTETGHVSYYAQDIVNALNINIDEVALLEFTTAGYTLGNKTLHPALKTLQAGEFVMVDTRQETPSIKLHRYYRYKPRPAAIKKEEALQQLDDALNQSIEASIDLADGAPIWVPLSGGMDSRLILSKLHELGCKHLHSFSYGIKNNDEARTAKNIATALDVPWHFVAAQPAHARGLYQSQIRKKYEDFAHGFSTIPNYVEFEAIYRLKQENLAATGAYIINGQTGDFLSGGHIPGVLFGTKSPSTDDLVHYILDKHFSIWPNLKNSKNLEKLTHSIRASFLPPEPSMTPQENLMRQYESFEWQERQCKMVVHGQRVYEYFDFNWSLPLWHTALMDFFEALPFDLKYKQSLYMEYLYQYNYRGVFNIPRAIIRTWKPHQYWIIVWAKILELTQGECAKNNFYKKMLYYGHARNQYALFEKNIYNLHYKDIRNMISLAILDFLNTHNIKFPPT